MARAYGWKNDYARQYANNLVKDITGIDTLALLNIPVGHSTALPPIRDFREELTRIVGQYLEKRCDLEAPGRVSSAAIYSDFCTWFAANQAGEIPTQTLFGSIMANYRRKIKSHGTIFYSGLALRAMEVTQ